mmetsp:Transcript_78839/g.219180  ORF Transcript_78839/g.219180 Transcript_78839/m.219180 type:complete len:202 (+) Transcript_78839:47-652(+)
MVQHQSRCCSHFRSPVLPLLEPGFVLLGQLEALVLRKLQIHGGKVDRALGFLLAAAGDVGVRVPVRCIDSATTYHLQRIVDETVRRHRDAEVTTDLFDLHVLFGRVLNNPASLLHGPLDLGVAHVNPMTILDVLQIAAERLSRALDPPLLFFFPHNRRRVAPEVIRVPPLLFLPGASYLRLPRCERRPQPCDDHQGSKSCR